MSCLVLQRDDFKNNGLGVSFDEVLYQLGIETHAIVAGRAVDREINEVTIWVSRSEAEEG